MKKVALTILAMALVPCCALAIDGQVVINQSTVLAAGGFPYRITQTGSYKLTGNLVVPVNQVGILISANNVALDLNGFNVQCSADQTNTNPNFGCIASTLSAIHNIAIRNGTLTATATSPTLSFYNIETIALFYATFVTVENIQAEVNTVNYFGHAINVGVYSIIRNNITSGNQGGLNRQCPSLIEGNINNGGGSGGGGVGCVLVNNIGPI